MHYSTIVVLIVIAASLLFFWFANRTTPHHDRFTESYIGLFVVYFAAAVTFTVYSETARLTATNIKVLNAFGLYLAGIVAFAASYRVMYNHDRSSFFLMADLATYQKRAVLLEADHFISASNALLSVLNPIISEWSLRPFDRGAQPFRRDNFPSGSTEITFTSTLPPHGNPATELTVMHRGLKLRSFDFIGSTPSSDGDLLNYHVKARDSVERSVEMHLARKDSLESEAPDLLGPIEFLYFSVITQTTVGYGDIVPNSRPVRLLAIAQILFGFAVVAVVINLIWPGETH